jgi:SLT domain-containing protein
VFEVSPWAGVYDTAALPNMVTPDMSNDLYKAIADKTEQAFGTFMANFGAAATGSLGQWIAAGMAFTGVPTSWAGPLNTLIMRESGGNPRAINLWDSNARAGHPSIGLMQTIGPTFSRYRDPRLPNVITDPISNIVAGINYIKRTYGTIFNVQQAVGRSPRGYDSGGWLPPGATMAVNKTGTPEAILTGRQWDSVQALAAQGASGGGTGAVINVYAREGQNTEAIANDVVRRLDFSSRTG